MYSKTEKYASPRFETIDISSVYTHNIASLGPGDCSDRALDVKQFMPTGENVFLGIPFRSCGDRNNILLLKDRIKSFQFTKPISCKQIVFLHAADYQEDSPCEDGIYVKAEFAPDSRISKVHFKIPTKSGNIDVIDYASAGATWDEAFKYRTWMPC